MNSGPASSRSVDKAVNKHQTPLKQRRSGQSNICVFMMKSLVCYLVFTVAVFHFGDCLQCYSCLSGSTQKCDVKQECTSSQDSCLKLKHEGTTYTSCINYDDCNAEVLSLRFPLPRFTSTCCQSNLCNGPSFVERMKDLIGSSTLRLYASRKEGGRGLVSVRATIQDETSEIHKYIKDKAPTDGVLSECLRQWGTDEVLEEEPSWEDKPLHGMYHRNITEVADLKKSYQWLERAGLKDSTEALILAAQEQALSTRAIEAQIYHTRQDPRCRLCKEAPETVQHITAGCKMLAGKAYMERHNQVAGIVYRNICAEYGLETPRSKWETPPKVVENDRAKILWDFQIQTDRMVMANQPDIVVVDKEQRRAVVVDVAIPSDGNIRRKEHEKLEKYQGLREELEKAWKVKATVVPVVIGALGAVTPNWMSGYNISLDLHPTSQSRKVQS
ncbi:hypothetical protein WMY93_009269 [Mugilogobius chulae]|uniref:CD59 glycoprotein n=1 Tax=Mugilogobius chulae TaxID=88201 RepID=A0AAW0PEC5_9GOBI